MLQITVDVRRLVVAFIIWFTDAPEFHLQFRLNVWPFLSSCFPRDFLRFGANLLFLTHVSKWKIQARPLKLDDKQSERDHRELRIDKVGVRGLRFPIQVRDKAHSVQNTVATHRDVCGSAEGIQGHAHEPVRGGAQRARQRHPRREHHGHFAGAAKEIEFRDVAPGDRVSVFHVQEIAGVAQGKPDGLRRAVRRGGVRRRRRILC